MSTQQRIRHGRKLPHHRLFGERLEDRVMLAVVFSHDLDDPVRAVVPTQADYDEFGLEWTGSSVRCLANFGQSSCLNRTGEPVLKGGGSEVVQGGVAAVEVVVREVRAKHATG